MYLGRNMRLLLLIRQRSDDQCWNFNCNALVVCLVNQIIKIHCQAAFQVDVCSAVFAHQVDVHVLHRSLNECHIGVSSRCNFCWHSIIFVNHIIYKSLRKACGSKQKGGLDFSSNPSNFELPMTKISCYIRQRPE